MATMRLRTVALAAAISGGMLGEALNCQSAQADVQAFAGTYSSESVFYATLELFNSAGEAIVLTCGLVKSTTCLTTNGAQGSIVDADFPVPPSLGGAAGGQTSYTAGVSDGYVLADYFLFNLGDVTTQTVASAELLIYSGTITNNLTFTLSSISQTTIPGLENNTDPPPNTTLYGDLQVQPGITTSYGSFPIPAVSPAAPDGPGTLLTFTFTNATTGGEAALTAINLAIGDGMMGFAGNVTPLVVPEPSTWVMMLAGFAGLGLVARRRAARRRAAAAAG
jgi:PEP-CTERM motif